MGNILSTIILIGFIVMVAYFGITAFRRMGPVQLNVPTPQVVVPGKIDVNVVQPK